MASSGKPSKQVRAKLESFVVALTKKGIKLLALDFDKTFIDIHSGGMWDEGVDKLASHVRPCMKDLLETASNKGLFVAIVTFHRQGWLIQEVLNRIMPKKVAIKVYVQANTGDFLLRQRLSGTGNSSNSDALSSTSSSSRSPTSGMNGKQAHIAAVISEIHANHNVALKKNEIILMDDDIENVRIASSFGHFAFQVQQNVDYPSFESFETMLLL